MSGIFTSFNISSSGLSSQRRRMDSIASNIANVETTSGPDGSFYKRRRVHFNADPRNEEFVTQLNKASVRMARTNPLHLKGSDKHKTRGTEITLVKTNETRDSEDKYKFMFDPDHPDADERGYVKLPDINIMGEMVDMMVASRAYEANVVTIEAFKNMAKKALDI